MASIGEAARQSGVAVETIRYYERANVVPPPPRTESGRRVYGRAEIARLRMIRRCRDMEFQLADARILLDLAEREGAPCGDVKQIAERHLEEVRRKQRELAALEAALASLVASCEGGTKTCPALRELAHD